MTSNTTDCALPVSELYVNEIIPVFKNEIGGMLMGCAHGQFSQIQFSKVGVQIYIPTHQKYMRFCFSISLTTFDIFILATWLMCSRMILWFHFVLAW